MKIKTNYHSHNTFCDGKNTMEEIVLSAISKNFTHFGISSHAPVPFDNTFALTEENFTAYKNEFLRLKEKFKHKIQLFLGLEMDFISDLVENISQDAHQKYCLDYFIGCVHQVKEHNTNINTWFIDGSKQDKYDNGLYNIFYGDIQKAVTCFYKQQSEMIIKNRPDILGHCDKVVMHNKNRYFQQNEKWYRDLVYSLFDTVIKYNTIIEVNTRGLYRQRNDDFYPSHFWLKYLVEKHVPLTISTDAHTSEEVDLLYKEALEYLQSLNCGELYYFDGVWKAEKINNFMA
ncbi:MAG: histidinol-phosphatase [Bacteroidales bacterium]